MNKRIRSNHVLSNYHNKRDGKFLTWKWRRDFFRLVNGRATEFLRFNSSWGVIIS